MATIKYNEYFNAFPCVYNFNSVEYECPYIWTDCDYEGKEVSREDHEDFQEHNAILMKIDDLICDMEDEEFNDLIYGRAVDFMADIPGAKALLDNVKNYLKVKSKVSCR